MKARLIALGAGVTLGAALVFGSGAALADKPAPVPPHRHYMVVNGTNVFVGPNFCAVEATAQGHAAFHHKVHVTNPGVIFSAPCP